MSFVEKASLVGKTGTVSVGGLVVGIKIVDYKFSYGNHRWQVEPLIGDGRIWVEESTLRVDSGKK